MVARGRSSTKLRQLNVGLAAELLGNDAHLLERLTKRLRHLSQRAFAMGWTWVSGEIVQIRGAELRVPQPIVDHVRCDPREALLTPKILLSHARCISGWE